MRAALALIIWRIGSALLSIAVRMECFAVTLKVTARRFKERK